MKKFIALGVIVFLLSIIVYVPASIATKLLPNNITAKQYFGNIWQGSATELRINNIELGTVKWQFKPSCLFTMSVCADIQQENDELNSQFTAKMRNNLELLNVFAQGDAMILNALLQSYGITSTGEFTMNLDKVSFKHNFVNEIEGNINFTPLALNGVIRVFMGNVNSVIQTKDNHTVIAIENSNGHLDLTGDIKLFEDLTYHADVKLKQNERSTDFVINGMKYVGTTQSDGSVRIDQKGRLTI
ncbi:MAG: type II secretion system protein N [Bacteroidota bacterium]